MTDTPEVQVVEQPSVSTVIEAKDLILGEEETFTRDGAEPKQGLRVSAKMPNGETVLVGWVAEVVKHANALYYTEADGRVVKVQGAPYTVSRAYSPKSSIFDNFRTKDDAGLFLARRYHDRYVGGKKANPGLAPKVNKGMITGEKPTGVGSDGLSKALSVPEDAKNSKGKVKSTAATIIKKGAAKPSTG